MSNLVARRSNNPKVYRKRRTKKNIRKSRCKLPLLRLVFCTALVTSSVALGAWSSILANNSSPVAPSAATQDEPPEPKMPRMNPYVPLIGV